MHTSINALDNFIWKKEIIWNWEEELISWVNPQLAGLIKPLLIKEAVRWKMIHPVT